ncbi:MAG: hypothetical protein COT15_05015 [Candidatus Diapherotrites archaeon CG08_land_8_20_14_0_20_34_12]|nr:MAG: hypothetical protein COT15_05015 [Candidatus Diapherotrites archaeon CG08_land_8_20_14_0_20_34_12]
MYITKKRIKGKEYAYLVKSIRLTNGKIIKIQKILKTIKKLGELEAEFKDYFREKEKNIFQNLALKQYSADSIFTELQTKEIEDIRTEYSWILNKLSKKQLQDLFDRFTINFTYESNAIEGNSLTLKDVQIVIFENTAIKGRSLREIYETRNSRKVIDLILKGKFGINEKDIIKMHKMLMRDIDSAIGYKKVPNFLLGRNIETTLPEKVPEEMHNLVEWYNEKSGKMHPLKLSALFHGKFEKIHPFEDGNGRVGRFLINTILADSNYPPLIIRKSQRIAYLKTLEDFDNGYTANLERFLLEKYKNTFKNFFQIYVKYI